MGAALAAVVSTVLVGVGMGGGSAAGVEPVPVTQAALPLVDPQPQRVAPQQAPVTPAPTSARQPEPTRDTTPAPTSSAAAEPTAEPTTAAPTAAPPAAVPVRSAAPPQLVPGTPCTTTAKACVDLDARKAWLVQDGHILRRAESMMVGDEIDPTPKGTFQVEWKAEQWTSREYLTEMPYAVFFAEGGIAFHQGPQDTNSAGCVKLVHDDAVAWFNYLQVGDEVQIR